MARRTEPEGSTYLGIRIPTELKRRLEDQAAQEDLKLTDIVRRAMREYLARRKKAA
jgi:predicted transcriptional regulator